MIVSRIEIAAAGRPAGKIITARRRNYIAYNCASTTRGPYIIRFARENSQTDLISPSFTCQRWKSEASRVKMNDS